MGEQAKKLLQQVLALPREERTAFVEALEQTLAKATLSDEWQREIRERIAAVERGDSALIEPDEVDRRLADSLAVE